MLAQATFVATPSGPLVFDVSKGLTPKDVAITLANTGGQSTAVFNVTATTGVSAVVLNAPNTVAPNTIRVSVDPSVLPVGSQGHVNISGTGFNTLSIPVQVVNGTAATSFTVSPTSVSFVQNGSATPGAATVTVSSSNGAIPSYTISGSYNNGSNWLSVSPTPGTPTTSGTVTITPQTAGLTPGVYTATIVLSPAGFAPVSIPVTLSIDQAVGTALTLNPTSLTFNGSQNNFQTVSVSSGVAVGYTVSVSPNIASYLAIFPTLGTTPSSFQVTVPNPSLVPSGTVGTITVTPTANSGFTATTIPVTINTTGSTLVVNPSSLSFTGAIGSGTNTPKQLLSVTTSDFTPRQFQVTATSTSNFLMVDNNFPITPENISVGVNMSGITQPGTYFGTIAITPLTGGGATTFVQVTLNAVQSITVTPDPASVTLSAGAGSNSVQRAVMLNSSLSNAPFTTTATTTGGQEWLSVTTTATTLPASITIVANPAGLGTGTYSGSVAVTSQGVTVATIPVTFTVTPAATLQLTPSSLVFNYETSSSSVPAAQAIQVASNNGTNIPWTASVVSSSSWLQINQTPGNTPGTLNVSVVPTGLTPGTYTGSISVASTGASNSPQTVNVTLNVTTPAVPLITSFQNGASFEQTLAVPGTIITIRGTDMGPAVGLSGQINQGSLATTVGDVEVLFDGIPAPIVYASATQINAVVPYELYGRTTTRLQVRYKTQRSRELELRVQDTNPGIFTSNASGTGQAAALNQNNSVNSPSNPEQRGNVIVLYATGMGQTNPGGTTGRIMTGTDLRRPLAPVTVRIGGQTAEVTYAGSAPGLVAGAVQVNARIPSNSIIGANVPVQVQIGNVTSQGNVTISIQ